MECLHTILLGPVKYFLKELMDRLMPKDKDEIIARINYFDFSGFSMKIEVQYAGDIIAILPKRS